ncbi:3D domain-containing protein [Flagellimonas pacifica]|uniref:3D (Asp-Asp-Asp) domain-containing protein n=1 Tax=Flagellimonas pacifica TaxID=1247520 RepID=A0A285MRT9_9FLAO|nr:3D (Asp-Asp-Asp) domain-containing protein [Allomuricauda parva]
MKKLFLFFIILISCKEAVQTLEQHTWYGHEVTVSAYNSVSWQTQGDPTIAAWGDTLKPGMKSIAISRDLLKMGFNHNTMVKIDTFPDTFYVKDKMHRRWKNRIDLYMGVDVKKAREWGRKKLFICYAIPVDSTSNTNLK